MLFSSAASVPAMTTIVEGTAGVRALAGQQLGYSDWHEVTQDQVDRFADATGDHQWIHVDVERAKAGPFGGTIAHGYLTLSLAPVLLNQIWQVQGVGMGINYGCNRVRFPSPVPVGSKVRLGATLAEVEDVAGGLQAVLDLVFEVDGKEKPSCVAQVVFRYYD